MSTVELSELGRAALAYAAKGYPVFPCQAGGKRPLSAHGCKDASTDPDRIREWWLETPSASIGLATGERLVAVDIDGETGRAALDKVGPLPDTLTVQTGGGGRHLYFDPGGAKIGNSAGKLGPGIDVRGEGGYVIAPPSRHATGRRYLFRRAKGTSAPPIATLPKALLARLTRPEFGTTNGYAPAPLPADLDGGTPYGLAALQHEVADVLFAAKGRRNHQLNLSTFNLAQLAAGGELSEDVARAELAAAALACGLSETEARRTIESGLRAGMSQPRRAPESRATLKPREEVSSRVESLKSATATESVDALAAELSSQHPTDLGNCRRLVHRHGGDLRYAAGLGWLAWDGKRWRPDGDGEVARRAKDSVRMIYAESATIGSDDRRRKLAQHAVASEARSRIAAMIGLASTEPEVVVAAAKLDANPWELNVGNGLLDLRTGILKPHARESLCSKLIAIEYDDDATSREWDEFLKCTTDGDDELVGFLRRAAGYSLTGDVREEVLFFGHGQEHFHRGAQARLWRLRTDGRVRELPAPSR